MFAEAVIELLSNEERMRDMSQNGIECIESYWAIEKAGERPISHLTRVVEEEEH